MSPLRWDVVVVGLLLSLPVLALGLRGDLTPEEVATRVLWCLAAGWGVVALLRVATSPRPVGRTGTGTKATGAAAADSERSRAA
ncbi:MAG: hypothetical protein JWQ45_1108 [Blastococcus sp.]|jgi:hypothetical protein|nr:hypothetical protein [Blastococcus sp.]